MSLLAISAWTKIHPRAFYGLWSMVNTADSWYSRVRDDDELIGPVLAGTLQEDLFSDLLKPGNPPVSDDRVEMTDPRSRSGFFLWLLKTGNYCLRLCLILPTTLTIPRLVSLVFILCQGLC